ncbi:MAG: response regulator [Planctomycetes bacterium]|nr:response regulator [Planctomycetota bacterium]
MSQDRPLVLIIEDEMPIRRFLRATLSGSDYRVVEAETAAEGMSRATNEPPDLMVLDLGLPDGDGLQVIDWFRDWSSAPIIVLSARGQERDKVAALDRGADDYLTKPFGVGELQARIRVALRNRARRDSGENEPAFEVGDLRVDLARRRAFLAGVHLSLTPLEYRLLVTLVRHAGKVLTHGFILREVWGPNHSDDPRYVRVFVANLRRRIEPNPARPRYLLTEQGVGYRLVDHADDAS